MVDAERQQQKEDLAFVLAVARARAGLDVQAILKGRSMWPTLRPGVLVKIEAKPKEYRCGDIVLLGRSDGAGVIHRLIRLEKHFVITKGDGLPYLDHVWQRKDLLGKVVSVDGRDVQTPTRQVLGRIMATISPFSRWPFSACMRLRKIVKSSLLKDFPAGTKPL